MIRHTFSLLAFLSRLAVLLFCVLGLGFLGLRYVILPDINHWRPQIQRLVSQAVGSEVTVGAISANWGGLYPSFQLQSVNVLDAAGEPLLAVPELRAVLDWRSVLALEPRFVSLFARDVNLEVRRADDGRLWVLGQAIDPADTEPVKADGQSELVHWMLGQRRIMLRNATLRWQDDTRSPDPLVLTEVSLDIVNRPDHHAFGLSALPPAGFGSLLDIRAEFVNTSVTSEGRLSLGNSTGKVYASVQEMHPAGWQRWIDLPLRFDVDEVSARLWLELAGARPVRAAADVQLRHVQLPLPDDGELTMGALRFFADGSWSALQRLAAAKGQVPATPAGTPDEEAPPSVAYRFAAQHISLKAPSVIPSRPQLAALSGEGQVFRQRQGAASLAFDTLQVNDPQLRATLSGQWRQGGDGPEGLVDIKGDIRYLDIDAIDLFLPLTVNADAREWMAESLRKGDVDQGSLMLSGDLFHFPFQQQPAKGEFLLEGRYRNAVIDYLPAQGNEKPWPALHNLQGTVRLHRADLQITGDSAEMSPAPGQTISLRDIHARMPDIEADGTVLTIRADTQAPAPAYLSLMTHSPLGAMLDGVLDQATGSGDWQVPLTLDIPLEDTDKATVSGTVLLDDDSVQLAPGMPALSGLKGSVAFSESGLGIKDLKGELLGGPVTVSGGLGKDASGVLLRGEAGSKALAGFAGVRAMQRLEGSLAYVAQVQQKGGDVQVQVESDLKGLALRLPPPLGKSADTSLPLKVNWSRFSKSSMALRAGLGPMTMVLLHPDRASGKGPFFRSGWVAIGQQPKLPPDGLLLDLRLKAVDLDAWDTVLDEFSQAPEGSDGIKPVTDPLPRIRSLRLQADSARALGQSLEFLTFTATRPDSGQWRVDVSSSEVAGTLFWREANGRVAGRVDARFDRLQLGDAPADGEEAPTERASDEFSEALARSDAIDIPGISLYVKHFSLYGMPVGELTVMGLNQSRGRLWRLDELRLASEAVVFTGSGLWRLEGESRGLQLDLSADVRNLGEYFSQIGHKGIMEGGAGQVHGRLEWRNVPWSFDRADLNGELSFDLQKGRFSSVSSYTARLLELLSLQSVKRLATFNFSPRDVAQEGFPYDRLAGKVDVKNGVMHTRDYRVTGPAATIVLEGSVNLVDEALNLDAVVVPNLDVSGAAVAAGIAVNPIVGIGAFLGQLLLQTPLSKAMTVQYHIDGSWKDPKIKEVPVAPGAAEKKAPAP